MSVEYELILLTTDNVELPPMKIYGVDDNDAGHIVRKRLEYIGRGIMYRDGWQHVEKGSSDMCGIWKPVKVDKVIVKKVS